MSEYYDHYHRWEPLAEFHFHIDSDEEEFDDDNYLYCLCSRAYIRDNVKTYSVEKEEGSESDLELLRDSHSQELDEHSHVHFSLDTSYKVKCEKDEGASCYCSASHTENCCSTDEHDPTQTHGTISNALQPSDSGADLTYPDCHSDFTNHDKMEKIDIQTTETNEDYLSETSWEKFWAVHGERLIWASWIKKYSDYINPEYLDENKELHVDENNIPKQHSAEPICQEYTDNEKVENGFRERKFSYDSKVNPYKKNKETANEKAVKNPELTNKDEQWLPIGRRRSCSEHDRILSPKTIDGTDSMTNVTKITLSSYDVTSSRVTSNSSPTDDCSALSSTSEDQSNEQTRIVNGEDNSDQLPLEEMDTEQYWQFLWKQHFGEQYALHYANYVDQHNINSNLSVINTDIIKRKDVCEELKTEIECENSEGNSTDMPTIIENHLEVEQSKSEKKATNSKKGRKRNKNRYIDSVGYLLQNLLKEEQKMKEEGLLEVNEAGDNNPDKTEPEPVSSEVVEITTSNPSMPQSTSNNNFTTYSYDGGDDDPPEEKPIVLKRSHELDEEEDRSEKIKSTFEKMGFCLHADKMPKGQMVYRKRSARLRPPRYKRFNTSKKTYFDEEGNSYQLDQDEEDALQTDDCLEDKSEIENDPVESTEVIAPNSNLEKETSNVKKDTKNDVFKNEDSKLVDTSNMLHSSDSELICSDVQGSCQEKTEEALECTVSQQELTKRRRRQKRHARLEDESPDLSDLPPELRDEPKMMKYWKKRHSLFHRFDEGIQLDRESWFSVTPENVARHIATKCAYDTLLDAFCGAGGNTIQFAKTCKKVIAVDIDPEKIVMAKHNATVYGVADRIEFIVGDFFELAHKLSADMVFLSPPWGGPEYSANEQYDIETMLAPKPASELINIAKSISPTIALYLPRNSRADQILSLAKELGGSVEVEQSFLDKRFVAITAYFY